MKRKNRWTLLLLCVLILSACGEDQRPPEPEEGVLVYACLNPRDKETRSSVENFNRTHEDVQIEIRDYSSAEGIQRLLVELAAGYVPDLMDLYYFGKEGYSRVYTVPLVSDPPADEYWMPYRQLAQKGYLEDLWPYIENDPALGREKVLLPPLKAAEVNGGLYMLFRQVRINTLMGAERVVGARYGWTFEEFLEAFSTMPPDSTPLRYTTTRHDVFFKMLCFSLTRYVDWETGECFFDGEEFRNMLAFLECFPEETEKQDWKAAEAESIWRMQEGEQMLEGVQIGWPGDFTHCDALWRGRTSFVGYPTADGGSGSFFYPDGRVIAMSSTCRDKEAAWDFLRRMLTQRYKMSNVLYEGNSICINLHDFELILRAELWRADKARSDFKNSILAKIPWAHFSVSQPQIFALSPMAEEDIQRYEALINNTTQLYWPDDDLANIVWESIGPYLAGDRTMDDTIRLLDNRVGLYLNEQR